MFFQAKENESQTNSKADAEQQTDQGKSYFWIKLKVSQNIQHCYCTFSFYINLQEKDGGRKV